jgi:RNA polymerase sigma factor (sigma-70 family)
VARGATFRLVPLSDEQLLTASAAGDDQAFALFYRRHLDAVIAFLRRRVAAPEQAFDLAAETFAVIALQPAAFRGEGPATAWMYGIARNVLRSSLRRGRIEHAARQRLGTEPTPLTDEDLLAVEERAAAGSATLQQALEALPDPTRRALLARVVEEREYPDIAMELDCSEHVVRQRVHRGLARLRERLEETQ